MMCVPHHWSACLGVPRAELLLHGRILPQQTTLRGVDGERREGRGEWRVKRVERRVERVEEWREWRVESGERGDQRGEGRGDWRVEWKEVICNHETPLLSS